MYSLFISGFWLNLTIKDIYISSLDKETVEVNEGRERSSKTRKELGFHTYKKI